MTLGTSRVRHLQSDARSLILFNPTEYSDKCQSPSKLDIVFLVLNSSFFLSCFDLIVSRQRMIQSLKTLVVIFPQMSNNSVSYHGTWTKIICLFGGLTLAGCQLSTKLLPYSPPHWHRSFFC